MPTSAAEPTDRRRRRQRRPLQRRTPEEAFEHACRQYVATARSTGVAATTIDATVARARSMGLPAGHFFISEELSRVAPEPPAAAVAVERDKIARIMARMEALTGQRIPPADIDQMARLAAQLEHVRSLVASTNDRHRRE